MPFSLPGQHFPAGEDEFSESDPQITARDEGRASSTGGGIINNDVVVPTIVTSFDPFGLARTRSSVSIHRRRGSASSERSIVPSPSTATVTTATTVAIALHPSLVPSILPLPPSNTTTLSPIPSTMAAPAQVSSPSITSNPRRHFQYPHSLQTSSESPSSIKNHAYNQDATPRSLASLSSEAFVVSSNDNTSAAAAVAMSGRSSWPSSASGPSPAEFEIRIIENRAVDTVADVLPQGGSTANSGGDSKLAPLGFITNVGTGQQQLHPNERSFIKQNTSSSPPQLPPPGIQVVAPPSAQTRPTVSAVAVARKRLLSLDILRGITIFLMIMVNTQGAEPFRELAHAEWFGFTLADWVFPNFIFMVGMAIAIVFSPSRLAAMKAEESASRQPRQRRRQSQPHSSPKPSLFQRIQTAWKQRTTRTKMTFKVIKRSILLFLIGCALNAFELIGMPSEEQWLRVPGVLQRIAFCYFVLASTVLWLPQNLVKIGVPLVMTAIWFLLTYAYSSYPIVSEPISTCAMETLVEGVTYRLKPGQLAPSECTAQAYIDTMMFSKAKDPLNPEFHAEGSVGCFTSVVSAWFGWMMGLAVLDHQQRDKARTANLCRRETLRAEREKALYSLATMATASLSTVIAPSAEPRSPNSTTTWPSIAASGTSSSGASDTEMLLKKRSLHGVSSPPLTDAPPLSASTSSSLPTVSVSVADPLPSESPPSLLVSPPPPPRHSELILALPPSLPPPYQPEVDLQQELETQNRTQLLASLGTWFCTGTCVMAVGVFFGWFLPIGKPLWTPTYVLYAGGMSICALCILIHTYDVQSLHAVTPNPIVMTNQQQQHQQQQQQQQQQGLQEPSMDVSVATSASHRNGDNSHRVQTDSNGDVDDEEDENDDNDNQESRRRFKHWRTRCREGTRGFTTVLKTVSTKAADWTKRVYRWTVHVLLAELFIAYGRNPMLIYVLADVVAATLVHIKVPQGSGNYAWVDNVWAFIFFNSFYRFMNPTWASVVFSFVYVLLFFPLLWELDRRGLYLRL